MKKGAYSVGCAGFHRRFVKAKQDSLFLLLTTFVTLNGYVLKRTKKNFLPVNRGGKLISIYDCDMEQKGRGIMRLIRAGVHFYVIGLIILTLGIALTIQSSMGASPFDALLVGLHRTFGLTVGSFEIIVGLTMVLGNALAEKKRPEFFALITSFVTGVGIDTWLFLLGDIVVPVTWYGEWAALLAGTILMALGVSFYLQSKIAPNPMDRSMLVISNLTGWGVSYSRAAISVVLVILAVVFDGAIGIGTLINALFSGMIISFFLPYVRMLKNGHRKHSEDFVS
ncbi:YczE/YyaS/YitT family protein [Lentibacillus salinarum]